MKIYGQSYFIIIFPFRQESIRIMAFNFSVNAQNPIIGVLFVKIGIQLRSHFGKDIYQPCSASRVIDTHKVRFIAGIM